jgi:hypothetical protein
MPTSFTPAWSRFFGLDSSPATQQPHPSRLEACATNAAPPHPSRLEACAANAAPPHPSRLEACAANAAPPHPSRLEACAPGRPPIPQPQTRPAAPPPTRPVPPPTSQQPPQPRRPLLPCPRHTLDWVVCALPAAQRAEVRWAFEQTLCFRAGLEERSSLEGTQPIGRERFGLAGEALVPEGTLRVRRRFDDEVRETLRTLEAPLSRTRRNAYLAMHSARLGQLWRELEQRFEIDVLEETRLTLGRRWA